MAGLRIRPYNEADADSWDRFCEDCVNSTFLHTRRFLSYHGERFQDCSCIIEDGSDWVGILPAAQLPGQPDCVVSHPGATYGGLLHTGQLFGANGLAALAAVAAHYRDHGYRRLRYKALPHIYQQCPSQDDLYALFRLGGHRYRCDLSSTIDLEARRPVSSRRLRSRRKALKAGVRIMDGLEGLDEFWAVLTENLRRRHDTHPVHTLEEIRDLATRFPEAITLTSALMDGRVVAGTLLFHSPRVIHAQYIAASEEGQNLCALDAVFEHCIEAASRRVRYFDFGISNENDGLVLNTGLYGFKTEFGGGGVVLEFYEVNLAAIPAIVPETA